nr:hypothetical protein [Cellulosimicrobium sp. CUA-896]
MPPIAFAGEPLPDSDAIVVAVVLVRSFCPAVMASVASDPDGYSVSVASMPCSAKKPFSTARYRCV